MITTQKKENACIRTAYGQALVAYGEINPNVVVLDADMSSSTRSSYFAERFPDRFFNMGVAEAGMVDVAAGFALGGKIPFVNTLAFLLALRAAEQIRTSVCYARLNVKLAAAYGGFCGGFDGPTHHSLSDLATMRALPNLAVVVAADAVEARKLVPVVAEYDGPVYFRLSRAVAPIVYDESYQPVIGRGVILRKGSDITLICTGLMVAHALLAAEELEHMGIAARVMAINSIKPLDRELILEAACETGRLVTVEEHSVLGGLGGAVAELVSQTHPVPVLRIGINDCFAETGPHEDLLEKYGMGVKEIVRIAANGLGLSKTECKQSSISDRR